jgi:O-antigen/teichoic acid export membrane protein
MRTRGANRHKGNFRSYIRPGSFASFDLMGKILNLAALGACARALSAEDYGRLVAALTAAVLISVALDAGLSPRLVELTLREEEGASAFWIIKYGQLFLVTLTYAGFWISGAKVPVWLPIIAAAVSIQVVQPGALVALGRRLSAFTALAFSPLMWLCSVLALTPKNAEACLVLFAIANMFASSLCAARNVEYRPRRTSWTRVTSLLRVSSWTAVFAVASNGYSRLDTLLLAWLASPAEAGVYGTAYRFVTTAVGFTGFIVSAAARQLLTPDRTRDRLIRVQVTVYGAVATAVVAITIVPLTQFTAGSPLPGSAGWVLAGAVFPAVHVVFYTQASVLRGARKPLALAALKTAAIATVLYPTAIASLGILGAAFASVVTEVLAVCFYRSVLRGTNHGDPRPGDGGGRSRRRSPRPRQPKVVA